MLIKEGPAGHLAIRTLDDQHLARIEPNIETFEQHAVVAHAAEIAGL